MFNSVRARLTILNVAVMACLLIGFSIAIYAVLLHALYARADDLAKSAVSATVAMMTEEQIDARNTDIAMAPTEALKSLRYPDYTFAIFDPQGKLLAERPAGASRTAPLPNLDVLELNQPYRYTIRPTPGKDPVGRRAMALRVDVPPTPQPCVIVVSRSLAPLLGQLEELRHVLYGVVPIVLILLGLAGWFLADRSLAPVAAMSKYAQRIGARNTNERLPVANPRDELGQLAIVFNEMIERLAAAYSQQRQFMADASHELRTPVSVIRTETAVTLEREHRDEGQYRACLSMIDSQARQISHIVDDMFRLARADSGSYNLEERLFYLDETLLEATRSANVLGASRNVSAHIDELPEIPFRGDENLIRQMVLNLLDNAVKYNRAGGKIHVHLDSRQSDYLFTVSDTGIGIPSEAQSHIFERFFRADHSRTVRDDVHSGGAGLGLPIARWIAEAHGGSLDLVRSDENGSVFAIRLPASRSVQDSKFGRPAESLRA